MNIISGSPAKFPLLCSPTRHNLDPYLEQFEGVSAAASKEYSLEKALQRMEDEWDAVLFNTTQYRDTGEGGEGVRV